MDMDKDMGMNMNMDMDIAIPDPCYTCSWALSVLEDRGNTARLDSSSTDRSWVKIKSTQRSC